ncbi:MAG: uroporphyrinogen decarboxylase [Firmicutes bacterium HGW-Firmicutes-14]|nr:MAG: uroporphyrinogen decarboxylase [Firmicutes bacterium HGW-Firmicutes-14]
MDDKGKLIQERFQRYTVAMECGKPDKVPIALGIAEWAVKYTDYSLQEVFYDPEKNNKIVEDLLADFDVDIFGGGPTLWWPPMFDAMGSKLYKFPGLGLEENTTFQYNEEEYMKAEDYDDFIANPTEWLVKNFLPRISTEFAEPGSYRATVALIKSSAAFAMALGNAGAAFAKWSQEHGVIGQWTGITKAPFDTLGDALRGMKGILLDLRRRPDKVIAACETIVPHNIGSGLAGPGADRRFPCFAPLHRGAYPFLNPEQWDKFYWPTLKAVIEGLWAQGKRMFFFAEGDWTPYLEKIAELPDKSIIFHIDTTDSKKAKEILGGRFCLQGGIPTTLLTYGTPEKIKEHVKRVIDELACDGGFILAPGGVVMGDAKKENVLAVIEAAREYGVY